MIAEAEAAALECLQHDPEGFTSVVEVDQDAEAAGAERLNSGDGGSWHQLGSATLRIEDGQNIADPGRDGQDVSVGGAVGYEIRPMWIGLTPFAHTKDHPKDRERA